MKTLHSRSGSQGSPGFRPAPIVAPVLAALAVAGIAAGVRAAAGSEPAADERRPLSEDEFVHLHAALAPGGEAWRELPWESSLLEARERAVSEGKPIYMLVRSGHPLGAV